MWAKSLACYGLCMLKCHLCWVGLGGDICDRNELRIWDYYEDAWSIPRTSPLTRTLCSCTPHLLLFTRIFCRAPPGVVVRGWQDDSYYCPCSSWHWRTTSSGSPSSSEYKPAAGSRSSRRVWSSAWRRMGIPTLGQFGSACRRDVIIWQVKTKAEQHGFSGSHPAWGVPNKLLLRSVKFYFWIIILCQFIYWSAYSPCLNILSSTAELISIGCTY